MYGETAPVTGSARQVSGSEATANQLWPPSASGAEGHIDQAHRRACSSGPKGCAVAQRSMGWLAWWPGTLCCRRERGPLLSVVYRSANARLLGGVHDEARMTFLCVCSTCRLGLSRQAGPEEWEKGGYRVDYKLFDGRLSEARTPYYAAFIAVRPGQAVPVPGRWLVGWGIMGTRSVQRGHKKACVSICHQSRLS